LRGRGDGAAGRERKEGKFWQTKTPEGEKGSGHSISSPAVSKEGGGADLILCRNSKGKRKGGRQNAHTRWGGGEVEK